jgi:hypothetical protein
MARRFEHVVGHDLEHGTGRPGFRGFVADAVLSGFADEVRQAMFGIEVADLEGRRRDPSAFAGPPARGRDGVEVGGASAEVDLDGRRSRQTVMRPQQT